MSPIQKVQKRSGQVTEFDQKKIVEAIWKAAKSVGGTDRTMAEKIGNQVTAVLEVFFKSPDTMPTVEQVQDLVEKILIEGGHAKTAKAYILYRAERAREREQRELILGKENADENLNFSNNALEVLKRRYLLKDENGKIYESPKQMVERIANNIALADKNYGATEEEYQATAKKFYDIMANLEYMPNSPTIMNAGTEVQQLSACFVLPVPDSIEGIFDALKYQAIIHKSGGGTGFSFSRLRPANDMVKSTTGVSSGPVSFMKIFDAATQEIKQGGKRRGANMGILRVDHPDIMEFITCKADMKTLTNFNISVAITDVFMEALKNDTTYDLINPRTKKPLKSMRAREVFNLILSNAWLNGDPGLVFIDRMNETNPVPQLGEIEATNPCGEQDLLPFDSCNLGSIAVNRFVRSDKKDFDWERLREAVHTTTHFLDNVIDMNSYPIPQIRDMSNNTRRIGLGLMGFADALYMMMIKYDSAEGLAKAEQVMKFIRE
jgi:ribonucleoside-diphosphate reductase alpha chain